MSKKDKDDTKIDVADLTETGIEVTADEAALVNQFKAHEIADKEVSAKRAAASKKVRDRKRQSLLDLLKWVKEQSPEGAILALVRDITPGSRVETVSAKNVLFELFESRMGDNIHEDDIFKQFKLGRTEMRRHLITLIKNAATPDDRMWVSFDPTTGFYVCKDISPNAPKDWTGYLPITIADMEIND